MNTPPGPHICNSPPRSPISPPGSYHNFYFMGSCLSHDAYRLNIAASRLLISHLASTVNELELQIRGMRQRHEESEQENQLEIYWLRNKLKDYEEQQHHPLEHQPTCDARYYLHKYIQKKKLLQE